MTWITMGALLTAVMPWRSAANSQFLTGFVVCFGAGVVMQAAQDLGGRICRYCPVLQFHRSSP